MELANTKALLEVLLFTEAKLETQMQQIKQFQNLSAICKLEKAEKPTVTFSFFFLQDLSLPVCGLQ